MDPNAALEELRKLSKEIESGKLDPVELSDAADRIAELFQGLDEWICKGGFLPGDWSKGR